MDTFCSLCDDAPLILDTEMSVADALRDAALNASKSGIPAEELYKIQRCLYTCNIIENTANYKYYADIIESIRFVVGSRLNKVEPFTNREYWFRLIGLAKSYYEEHKEEVTSYEGTDCQKCTDRAESIRWLSRYGITWKIENNEIVVENTGIVFALLNEQIARIGGRTFIEWMLSKNQYDQITHRYNMHIPNVSCIEKVARAIPWQMLTLIAYKYLGKKSESSVCINDASMQVIVLSQHFASAFYPVQPYNQFELLIRPQSNPLSYIQRLVLLESIFNLRQSSSRSMRYICLGLIDAALEDNLVLTGKLTAFKRVMNFCMDCANDKVFVSLTEKDLHRKCHVDKVFLNDLVADANSINIDFCNALAYHGVNYDDYPLVRISSKELLISPKPIGSRFWYEALTRILRNEQLSKDAENKMGSVIEDLVRKLFVKHGIEPKTGNYQYTNKSGKKITGECDVLIDTPNLIYLIETKKKGWTNESREGVEYQEVIDIADSLLSSQRQAFKTTCALNSTECLVLDSGENRYELRLAGRRIHQCSLVPKDFGAIQINGVVQHILENFLRYNYIIVCEPDYPDKKKLEKSYKQLGKYAAELSEYVGELHGDTPDFHRVFFDSRFVTFEWIENILHDVKCPEDFENKIQTCHYVIFSTNDIYREQRLAGGFGKRLRQ